MTRFQHLLYVFGFWRFKFYRRWIGGRWAERYIEPTPHSSECPHWRWEPAADATFNDYTHAIEQWPVKLPKARVAKLSRRTPCCEECRAFGPCAHCTRDVT